MKIFRPRSGRQELLVAAPPGGQRSPEAISSRALLEPVNHRFIGFINASSTLSIEISVDLVHSSR